MSDPVRGEPRKNLSYHGVTKMGPKIYIYYRCGQSRQNRLVPIDLTRNTCWDPVFSLESDHQEYNRIRNNPTRRENKWTRICPARIYPTQTWTDPKIIIKYFSLALIYEFYLFVRIGNPPYPKPIQTDWNRTDDDPTRQNAPVWNFMDPRWTHTLIDSSTQIQN